MIKSSNHWNRKMVLLLLSLISMASFSSEKMFFAFEDNLPGWRKSSKMQWEKNAFLDQQVKTSQTGSLKLVSDGCYLSAAKYFKLEPDAEYEISVYIKAENVEGTQHTGASLFISDDNNTRWYTMAIPPLKGTFDWTKFTRTVKSSFFKKAEVYVAPYLSAKGTVWFDDLKIEKKKPKQKDISVSHSTQK